MFWIAWWTDLLKLFNFFPCVWFGNWYVALSKVNPHSSCYGNVWSWILLDMIKYSIPINACILLSYLTADITCLFLECLQTHWLKKGIYFSMIMLVWYIFMLFNHPCCFVSILAVYKSQLLWKQHEEYGKYQRQQAVHPIDPKEQNKQKYVVERNWMLKSLFLYQVWSLIASRIKYFV